MKKLLEENEILTSDILTIQADRVCNECMYTFCSVRQKKHLLLAYIIFSQIFRRKIQLIIYLRNLGGWVGLQCCYQFALKFRFPLITFSLVNRFTSCSHTMLLRSRPFHQHAVCSIVTFSLVDRFTHTQNCFVRDLYTDMPHCDLQMVGFALY